MAVLAWDISCDYHVALDCREEWLSDTSFDKLKLASHGKPVGSHNHINFAFILPHSHSTSTFERWPLFAWPRQGLLLFSALACLICIGEISYTLTSCSHKNSIAFSKANNRLLFLIFSELLADGRRQLVDSLLQQGPFVD